MRRLRSLVAPIAVLACLSVASVAVAASQEVLSAPNGDFELMLAVGSITDKDGDGNQDTATKPDKLLIRHQVCTHFRERPQTVSLMITIDRPGEEFDEQVTATGSLVTAFCHQQFIEDKVQNKWPSGAYTVTINAMNEFGDSATATVSIAIT